MTITIDTAPAQAGKTCPRCAGIVPVLVEGSDVCLRCDALIETARWSKC